MINTPTIGGSALKYKLSVYDTHLKRNYSCFENYVLPTSNKKTKLADDEQAIKVEVIKANIKFYNTQFIINKKGVLGGPKLLTENCIFIGRRLFNDDGLPANHINIHPADGGVSRIHCSIQLHNFFKAKTSSSLVCYALNNYKSKSTQKKLPFQLRKSIFHYVLGPTKISIMDMKSVSGTFVEINKEIMIEANDLFLVAEFLGITVIPLKCIGQLINMQFQSHKVYIDGKKTGSIITNCGEQYLDKPILLLKKVQWSKKRDETVGSTLKMFIYTGKPISLDIKDKTTMTTVTVKIDYRSNWYIVSSSGPTLYKSVSGMKCGERYSGKEHEVSNGSLFMVGNNVFRISWREHVVEYN